MVDILFIVENANLSGGTEILTFNLMNAMRVRGMNVIILSIIPYTGNYDNIISLEYSDYKLWNNIDNSIFNKLAFCILSDRVLRNILCRKIKELQPKLVINQTYDIITALPLKINNIAQVFNWSIIGYEQSVRNIISQKNIITRSLSSFFIFGLTLRRHNILNKIPKSIILTHAATEELKMLNNNIRDEQIIVIPDPLPYSEDSHNISSLNNNNIIFVGRLSREKGVMRLLRIWKKISKKFPNYTLSIYGDGNEKIEMENFIKAQSINNVKFMGFISDLKSIYINADLLCMTSDTEGFGMVLIESMYFGVPCISFDCPVSPREIIGEAGIVIPCFDEDKYSNEIISLLSDSVKMKELQIKSLSRAKDFYMNRIVEKWINIASL